MVLATMMLATQKGCPVGGTTVLLLLLLLGAGCTPPGPRALLRGERLIEQGDYAKAVEVLQTATERLPEHGQAWNHLGLAHHRLGQWDEAVSAYNQALDVEPALSVVYYNLGNLYLEKGEPTSAIEAFRRFTEAEPGNVQGWLKLGQAQNQAERHRAARASWEEVLNRSPDQAQALNHLGLLELKLGNPRKSLPYFVRAARENPDYAPALLNLAIVTHQHFGELRYALGRYREYLALDPSPANAEAVRNVVRQLESRLQREAKGDPEAEPVASLPKARAAIPSDLLLDHLDRLSDPHRLALGHPSSDFAQGFEGGSAREDPATEIGDRLSGPTEGEGGDDGESPIEEATSEEEEGRDDVPGGSEENPGGPNAETEDALVADSGEGEAVAADEASADPPSREEGGAPGSPAEENGRAAIDASEAPASDQSSAAGADDDRRSAGSAFDRGEWRRSLQSGVTPLDPIPEWLLADASSEPAQSGGPESADQPAAAEGDTESAEGPASYPRYSRRFPEPPEAGDRQAARPFLEEGLRAYRRGNFQQAQEAFRRALEHDPAYFQAYHNLGLAAMEAGDPEEALEAYEHALALEPDSAAARYNLGLVLNQAGYPVDAAQELLALVEDRPEHVSARLALANLLAHRLDRPEAARSHYQRVLELDPGHPSATTIRYWLAEHRPPAR